MEYMWGAGCQAIHCPLDKPRLIGDPIDPVSHCRIGTKFVKPVETWTACQPLGSKLCIEMFLGVSTLVDHPG